MDQYHPIMSKLSGHVSRTKRRKKDTSEQPQVIVLPKDAIKIQDVEIPSIEAFDAKIKLKKDITKTWFTTKTATTVMVLVKMLPLP